MDLKKILDYLQLLLITLFIVFLLPIIITALKQIN